MANNVNVYTDLVDTLRYVCIVTIVRQFISRFFLPFSLSLSVDSNCAKRSSTMCSVIIIDVVAVAVAVVGVFITCFFCTVAALLLLLFLQMLATASIFHEQSMIRQIFFPFLSHSSKYNIYQGVRASYLDSVYNVNCTVCSFVLADMECTHCTMYTLWCPNAFVHKHIHPMAPIRIIKIFI